MDGFLQFGIALVAFWFMWQHGDGTRLFAQILLSLIVLSILVRLAILLSMINLHLAYGRIKRMNWGEFAKHLYKEF